MVTKIIEGIYKSSLPNGKILNSHIQKYKIQTVVDLTQRKRDIQRNTCIKNNITYIKIPIKYDCCNIEIVVKKIMQLKTPLLYFCFHGRGRAGKVSRLIKRTKGSVLLYRVSRNLNRAYRTCEAFGITKLKTIECDKKLIGNLYKAKGKVDIIEIDDIPDNNIIAFETNGKKEITQVDFTNVDTILIGGETHGIPLNFKGEVYRIPQIGNVSGLTVEAALAIILYEWGR